MNIASIDIGTNTIRLLIGRMDNARLIRIASDRAVTRLGKDLAKTGVLSDDSINKSLDALKAFKRICDRHNVGKIFAVGTSALREAENSGDFIDSVKNETGIWIEIISGEREAELTVRGVTAGFGDRKRPGSFFIIDIGGGSTEWIIYKGSNQLSAISGQEQTKNTELNSSLILMGSIPVGAVRLYEAFIKHDPPAPDELDECRNFIRLELTASLDASLISHHPSLSFIATGGTPTTIAAIDLGLDEYDGDKVHMHRVAASSLRNIFDKLVSLPVMERSRVTGMEPERADIIIPGTLILMTMMEHLNAAEAVVSDYGLLEGLISGDF